MLDLEPSESKLQGKLETCCTGLEDERTVEVEGGGDGRLGGGKEGGGGGGGRGEEEVDGTR